MYRFGSGRRHWRQWSSSAAVETKSHMLVNCQSPWLARRPKGCAAMPSQRIVAVGLLTQENLDALGTSLRKVYPIEDAPCFPGLA